MKEKKKHILFIVENNAVPHDIRVWREAKAARDANFDVSIISPVSKKCHQLFECIEKIRIYRHPTFRDMEGVGGQLLEYLNAFFWEMLLSVCVYIKRPFHIIHMANPPDNLFLIGLAFKILGVKLIFDHHDLSPELYFCKYKSRKFLIVKILRALEMYSCRTADVIISTNHSFKTHVIERYSVNPKKVFVVRNDPEVDFHQQSEDINVPSDHDRCKLVYVGAINVQDGVDLLIEIIRILVSDIGEKCIECKIIGDGEHLSQIKRLVTEYKLDNFFEFTGYIYDRELLNQYIKEADICLETAPDTEGNRKSTFIKIMEYMMWSKPIVAFDLPETRVSVNGSALLIEPGKLTVFANAIKHLMDNPEDRVNLGMSARRRIEEVLNWEVSRRELLKAYNFITDQIGSC